MMNFGTETVNIPTIFHGIYVGRPMDSVNGGDL